MIMRGAASRISDGSGATKVSKAHVDGDPGSWNRFEQVMVVEEKD
jgi:hypothetical protein